VTITRDYNKEIKELTIRITGDFDFTMLEQFRQVYTDLDLERVKIKIDLSQIEHFNSEALGMLLILREHAGGDESKITIAGCGQDLRRIFQASSFEKLFDISE
jgi:anti-anti-sigma factor